MVFNPIIRDPKMTLLRIPILTTLHLSWCIRANYLIFWTSIWFALFLFCGLYFRLSGTMEIDKAVRECDDRRLKTKYASAIYVIQRALALYSYVLSFPSFCGF